MSPGVKLACNSMDLVIGWTLPLETPTEFSVLDHSNYVHIYWPLELETMSSAKHLPNNIESEHSKVYQ